MLDTITSDFQKKDIITQNLLDNKTFMMEIIKREPFSVIYASDNLKDNDKDIQGIISMLKKHKDTSFPLYSLEYESKAKRDDKETVLWYIENIEGIEIIYASDRLKDDFDVAYFAMKKDPNQVYYEISKRLQHNEIILQLYNNQ